MKKQKRYLFIGIAAMMLFLTGCGDGLYELTAEEEDLIIHSAAYYVAKHNIQQKDGLTGIPVPEEEAEEESSSGEEETDDSNDNSDLGNGQSKPADDSEEMLSLAELIGHKDDLTVSYEGSYVDDSYMEGSAYLVDAEAGKTFYVMKFKLTNTTAQDVVVNNASKSPVVKLVSDGVTVKSEVTFLTSDFSTYQGTIGAGKSVETILLFEVSESVADQITEPTLQITIGNSTKTIKL